MADLMQRERKILADAWVQAGWPPEAAAVLASGNDTQLTVQLSAIAAALRAAPEGLIEQHARDSQELRRLCQSRDFYKLRCEALQAAQSNMRDPERKAVCDILANGSTSALASRPQGVKDAR